MVRALARGGCTDGHRIRGHHRRGEAGHSGHRRVSSHIRGWRRRRRRRRRRRQGGRRGGGKSSSSSSSLEGVSLRLAAQEASVGGAAAAHRLEVLQKHQWMLLDSSFSAEWTKVLRSLSDGGGGSSSRSRPWPSLAPSLDQASTQHRTVGSTIPAARDAFCPFPWATPRRPRPRPPHHLCLRRQAPIRWRAPLTGRGAPCRRVRRCRRVGDSTGCPRGRRGLGAGHGAQLGAAAKDAGGARGGAIGGRGGGSGGAVMLYPPRQVLLRPDPTRPSMPGGGAARRRPGSSVEAAPAAAATAAAAAAAAAAVGAVASGR